MTTTKEPTTEELIVHWEARLLSHKILNVGIPAPKLEATISALKRLQKIDVAASTSVICENCPAKEKP